MTSLILLDAGLGRAPFLTSRTCLELSNRHCAKVILEDMSSKLVCSSSSSVSSLGSMEALLLDEFPSSLPSAGFYTMLLRLKCILLSASSQTLLSNVFCHVVRRGILDFLCLMHWLPCKWPIWRKEKKMFHIVYKQQLLKNNDLTNGFMACLHDLVLQAQQLCDMFVLFLIFLNYLGLKQ